MARARPGKIILGELGGIETGVRQMLRQRPLETERVEVRNRSLTVPTAREILRVKAWLAVSRNQTRDYIDIAALADHLGIAAAADALSHIDEYYADVNQRDEAVGRLTFAQQASLSGRVGLLAEHGPDLGRPIVDRIQSSRHHNMKELRASQGGALRVLFMFDPRRQVILLIGGDKRGEWNSWYETAVPRADDLSDKYLDELQEEGLI